jgi:hypothetical protein
MTDLTFSSDEFADYWESYSEDGELGINFMAKQVLTDDGKRLLSNTVTTLAKRHGVSSDKVKTFRSALRKACKKAGLDDILSPKKVAGTGTAKEPTPIMILQAVKPHKKVVSPVDMCYRRMQSWMDKDGISAEDIMEAARRIQHGV